MATYPIRQLADNGGTAQFVPVTAPEAVQFPDGSNLNTLIGSIATIESNPVAANHAVGEFLCINGQVYEVIDAIAAGDSIALGENVQAANLGSQITALNNGLMPTTVPLSVNGRYMKGERAAGTGFTVNIPLFCQPTSVSGTGLAYYTGSAWTDITIANWAWNGVVLIVEFGNPPSAAGFYGLRGTINITY